MSNWDLLLVGMDDTDIRKKLTNAKVSGSALLLAAKTTNNCLPIENW